MSSRKKRAENWRVFVRARLYPTFRDEFKARLLTHLLGILTAVLVLLAQLYYGVISGNVHGRILSILWPYALLIIAFCIYHAARTPWLISNDHLDDIKALQATHSENIGALQATIRERDQAIETLNEKLNQRGPRIVAIHYGKSSDSPVKTADGWHYANGARLTTVEVLERKHVGKDGLWLVNEADDSALEISPADVVIGTSKLKFREYKLPRLTNTSPPAFFEAYIERSQGSYVLGNGLRSEMISLSGVKHSFRSTTIRIPDLV